MTAIRATFSRVTRGVIVGAVAVIAILLGPGLSNASAHATLVDSSVTAGGTVSSLPRSVVLTFDEAIQSSYATIRLTGPDGDALPLGQPKVVDDRVSAAVPASSHSGGSYAVAWRVVSADGHSIDGAFSFTVASGGPAERLSPQAAMRSSAAPPSATSSGDPFVVRHLVAISVGAVVVGLGLLLARRERHLALRPPPT